jgi:hypothetical protein
VAVWVKVQLEACKCKTGGLGRAAQEERQVRTGSRALTFASMMCLSCQLMPGTCLDRDGVRATGAGRLSAVMVDRGGAVSKRYKSVAGIRKLSI